MDVITMWVLFGVLSVTTVTFGVPIIKGIGKLSNKRKIAVLGDMLELGSYSKELHEKVGEEVNKNNIDILITVGKEAKNISKIAKRTVKEVYTFENNEQVKELLGSLLKKGDAVLVKASNGMKFSEICGTIGDSP